MNSLIFDKIAEGIRKLSAIIQKLSDGNKAFLLNESTLEDLKPLLDERDISLIELVGLEKQLLAFCRESLPPPAPTEVKQVLDILLQSHSLESDLVPAFRENLEKFLSSNRQVEEKLNLIRSNLNLQLQILHRSSKLLSKYSSNQPQQSCFIDKIK